MNCEPFFSGEGYPDFGAFWERVAIMYCVCLMTFLLVQGIRALRARHDLWSKHELIGVFVFSFTLPVIILEVQSILCPLSALLEPSAWHELVVKDGLLPFLILGMLFGLPATSVSLAIIVLQSARKIKVRTPVQ